MILVRTDHLCIRGGGRHSDHPLGQKDMLKFILLFHDPISVE
jgi:hypothetical protein